MKFLTGAEEKEARKWMEEARRTATEALCFRAKCGAVIIKDGDIIGRGYNAPPLNKEEERRCLDDCSSCKVNHDKTCCIHAEWRAIIEALKNNSKKLKKSKLYFTRVDEEENIKKSGKPYCTVCSRLALDVGVAEFVLWHEEGICAYPTSEYNELSYEYNKVEPVL